MVVSNESRTRAHDRCPAHYCREDVAMTAAELIRAALPISLGCMVLALGTRCALTDCTYLFRQPGLLVRSVLAMNVALPIVAMAIAAHTSLHPDVKIALIALAVSPV